MSILYVMYLCFVYGTVSFNPDLSVHMYVYELIKCACVSIHLHDLSAVDTACIT